ncbi:MAG: hypothetical protein PPP56_10160 [Longimonas sp.]|uniref:hypothetical protein n=1 Tax=Longimonas sp. TaxID=2039626 RepID=UPI00334B442D
MEPSTAPRPTDTSSTDPAPYEQGDALRSAFEDRDARAAELSLADVLDDPDGWDLTREEYWDWVAHLIRAGRDLDRQLNEVLHKAYGCSTSFYSLRSRKRLQQLMAELGRLQPQLRDLERDVKELALVIAADPDTPNTDADNFTMIVLDSANQTYDRAYQLCQDKLATIQQGWITATNMFLSIVMLIVTILFWMEFWE